MKKSKNIYFIGTLLFILIVGGLGTLHWLRQQKTYEDGTMPDMTSWRKNLEWKVVEVNGYNAKYSIMAGKDQNLPSIVYLPGLGSNFDLVGEFLKQMNDYGYEIVLAPFRGQRNDSNKLHGYSISQSTDDVDIFLQKINFHKDKKFIIMGQSFGGIVAIDYTLKYSQRVEKLVLLNTFACLNNFRTKLQVWVINRNLNPNGWLFKIVFAGHNSDELYSREDRDRVKENGSVDPKWVEEFLHQITDEQNLEQGVPAKTLADRANLIITTDLRNKVPDIKVPVLVMTGYYDKLTGEKYAYQLARAPQSKIVFIQKTGHHHLTTKPKESAEKIIEFLQDKVGL